MQTHRRSEPWPSAAIQTLSYAADAYLMGATWSFALDGPDATEVIEEVRREAHRLGREVIGEATVAEVVGSDGESKWWLSVHVERANLTNEHR